MKGLQVRPVWESILIKSIDNILDNLDTFLARKQKLIDIEKQMHFSYDLEATLTDEERLADKILAKLKKAQFKNDNYNIVLHDYFTNVVSITLN